MTSTKRSTRLAPRAALRSPRPRDAISLEHREPTVVAQAYAEGWIGLDLVLCWAEEQELEDDETMALLDLCAAEGHGH